MLFCRRGRSASLSGRHPASRIAVVVSCAYLFSSALFAVPSCSSTLQPACPTPLLFGIGRRFALLRDVLALATNLIEGEDANRRRISRPSGDLYLRT